MEFREFAFGSAEYRAALQLRETVLRRPLGLVLSEMDLAGEENQSHWGAFDSLRKDRLVACVLFKALREGVAKLRQMAVDPHFQGGGIGRTLILRAEQALLQKGVTRIELSARQTVANFYGKLGYQIAGQPFLELGIPHLGMWKTLKDFTCPRL